MTGFIKKTTAIYLSIATLLLMSGFTFYTQTIFAADVTLDGAVVSFKYPTTSSSFTVNSNSDRMMCVSYGTYQGGSPTGITWNGTALTKIVEQVGSYNEESSIWCLVAPEVGTFTVEVTGMGNWSAVGIYSLYNVDQNLPTNFATNGGESSSESVTLVTESDNSWVIAQLEAEPAIIMTTSGGIEDYNQQGASYQNAEGQHILRATAGSQSMTASLDYSARWNATAVEIKVASAGGGATPSSIESDVILFE